jgi:hypothetical protein
MLRRRSGGRRGPEHHAGDFNHTVPADSRAAARVWDDALGDVIQEGKKAEEELPVAHGCTEGTHKGRFVAKKTG